MRKQSISFEQVKKCLLNIMQAQGFFSTEPPLRAPLNVLVSFTKLGIS